MKYLSTRNNQIRETFTNVLFTGLSKDGGLYLPTNWPSLKIDDLIDPRINTVSSIIKHIHKGTIENAYTISNGEYEVIEAEIIESSELINKELKNSDLPDEIRIGAVLRNKKVIIPKSDFVFQKDDQIILIVNCRKEI